MARGLAFHQLTFWYFLTFLTNNLKTGLERPTRAGLESHSITYVVTYVRMWLMYKVRAYVTDVQGTYVTDVQVPDSVLFTIISLRQRAQTLVRQCSLTVLRG